MKEILTRRLEKKLVEKEQEIADMHASLREEMEKEFAYYDEQLSSLRSQLAGMAAMMDDLVNELELVKSELQQKQSSERSAGQAGDQAHFGSTEVVCKEDDAIVMIRRR